MFADHRAALKREYDEVCDYLASKNLHPDSYLGKANYHPMNQKAEILHEQTKYWRQPDIHYHQFLQRSENTLNLKLVAELLESLAERGRYDANDYLQRRTGCVLSTKTPRVLDSHQ